MSDAPRYTGVAVTGLFFLTVGVIMIFSFIAAVADMALPGFLVFKGESYNMLFIGLVNLASAAGLLYRVKSMWSITMVFNAVILVGSFMGLFLSDTANIVVIMLYAIITVYYMTGTVRTWYRIQ